MIGQSEGGVDESALMADAQRRSLLLGQDLYNDPRLNIGGTIQLRFNANIRQQDAAQSVDEFESGFLMRRVRIKMNGEFEFEDSEGVVPWALQTETNRSNGNTFVLDAWFGYETGDWRFRMGQFLPPLTREQLVSNTRRMAVEVSPVTGAFSTTGAGGRTQGAEARYRDDDWTVTIMVGDGDRGGNRSFEADEGDVGVYARVERKFGDESWRRFRVFSSKRG
ncbi:MAG: porin [Planctomycetota bacterium]